MKYLLIGGNGFIGKNIANALSHSHDVTIVGRGNTTDIKNVNYIKLDFVHCQDFTEYIKDIDIIIHLVSTIIPSDNLSNVNQEIAANVFPTTILLENAAKLKKQIIFISSGGTVYGENAEANTETSPTNPICNYGISKLLIEKYLYLYHHFYGLDYKIIRLSNPYSEEIYHGKKQGVIPIIIDNAVQGKEIEIWGENQVRDYIHIDDVTSGIISILNYTGDIHLFNLGSGIGFTVEEIVRLTETKINKKLFIKHLPARKCDVKNNILDIALTKQATGWSPSISLPSGIDKIIKAKLDKGNTK